MLNKGQHFILNDVEHNKSKINVSKKGGKCEELKSKGIHLYNLSNI